VGQIIPKILVIPILFELEKETGGIHWWMQIARSKGVENVGLMEEKMKKMGDEMLI